MDVMRWRYGETNPITSPVKPNTVIEIGDLVWVNRSFALPMKDAETDDVIVLFAGVAMQRSRRGDSDAIRIATTGVFEFECPLQTWDLGMLIGLHRLQGRLANQIVTKTVDHQFHIGKVWKFTPSAETKVLVRLHTRLMG